MKHFSKILLSLLAVASWWFAFLQEPSEVQGGNSKAHKIDYYLKDFTILTMTDQGHPKQHLKATYMAHFADDDSTELTLPQVRLLSPGKPPVNINSESGYVSADGELLRLEGAVSIIRNSSKGLAPIHVKTHNLRVQIAKDFAETDEFVKIISGNNTIQGTGLQAHFREPLNIKILHNVEANHEIK